MFRCCSQQSQTYHLGSSFKKSLHGPVVVEMKKQPDGTFGFTVNGGIEEDKMPILQLTTETSKRLSSGDIILAINGVNVAGCSVGDVCSLIQACGTKSSDLQLEVLPSKHGHASSLDFFLKKSTKISKKHKELYYQLRMSILENVCKYIVPCTTKEPGAGDVSGRHYIFTSIEEFQTLIQRNAFLEFGSRGRSMYGTLRYKEAEKIMAAIGKQGGDDKLVVNSHLTASRSVRFTTDGASTGENRADGAPENQSLDESTLHPQTSSFRAPENDYSLTSDTSIHRSPTTSINNTSATKAENSQMTSLSISSEPQTEPKPFLQAIVCSIPRPESGEFGFNISGGYPQQAKIHSIHPSSVVKNTFKVNDILVSVNGQDLQSKSHAELTKLIQELPKGQESVFKIFREKTKPNGPWDEDDGRLQIESTLTITLEQPEVNKGFGFSIYYDTDHSYNCVGDIDPQGLAQRSGRLQLGDYIANVNDIDVRKMDHAGVISVIRQCRQSPPPTLLKLIVERPFKNRALKETIEARQVQIRLLGASVMFKEKQQTIEQQLLLTEENLKSNLMLWTNTCAKLDELNRLPVPVDTVQLAEVEQQIQNYESQAVQDGVRAELLEEEFHAISLHIEHLQVLGSQITLSGVNVVASEELMQLTNQVVELHVLQKERQRIVKELQAIQLYQAMSGKSSSVNIAITVTKSDTNSSFGFSIVGGGSERVVIDRIVAGGPAAASLKKGDTLLAVNGRDVSDGNHEEIVSMITRSGSSVVLSLSRVVDTPDVPKFSPPPISIPRTNFALNDLTAIANECLDTTIQIQMEKRLIHDVQQTLQSKASSGLYSVASVANNLDPEPVYDEGVASTVTAPAKPVMNTAHEPFYEYSSAISEPTHPAINTVKDPLYDSISSLSRGERIYDIPSEILSTSTVPKEGIYDLAIEEKTKSAQLAEDGTFLI